MDMENSNYSLESDEGDAFLDDGVNQEQELVGDEPIQAPAPIEPEKEKSLSSHEAGIIAQLVEERQRRKELESRLQEYTSKQREQEAPPSIYDDESKAFAYNISKQTAPIREAMLHNSKLVAHQLFGEDSVKEAVMAFDEATRNGDIPAAIHQTVMNSPNQFEAAYRWHQREKTISETGGDLASYREKLLDDPEFLKLAALKLQGVKSGSQNTPVYKLPQSQSQQRTQAPPSSGGLLDW